MRALLHRLGLHDWQDASHAIVVRSGRPVFIVRRRCTLCGTETETRQ